jgi:hypothetical protein
MEYEWRIELNTKEVFRGYRPWSWTGSWGEMITIIKDKDRLLLNSICDPHMQSSVASYGWNKRNIETFLKNLSDVKRGIPAENKIRSAKREWTWTKVLVRLFAIPFCLFLIGLGLYEIFYAEELKNLVLGLAIIAIPSVYLFSDFKLMLRKGKRESEF